MYRKRKSVRFVAAALLSVMLIGAVQPGTAAFAAADAAYEPGFWTEPEDAVLSGGEAENWVLNEDGAEEDDFDFYISGEDSDSTFDKWHASDDVYSRGGEEAENSVVWAAEVTTTFEEELAAFPESYRKGLTALHNAHPSWHFIAQDTGTDWSRAVYEEYKFGDMLPEQNVGWWGTRAVSLTWASNISSWKSTDPGAYDWETGKWITGWDGNSLVIASREIVQYFMDPRNFLTESGIFQFISFRYTGGVTADQIADAARAIGTNYLAGKGINPDGSEMSYPQAILDAAEQTGVSPLYMVATITLENGQEGDSKKQIAGNTPGYNGLFNYYNIAAYVDKSRGFDYAYQRALWYAGGENKGLTTYSRPWNTRERAILGGAMYFAKNYLNAGQNTYYLKRFNVMSTAEEQFNHQFSTDIEGAYSEARLLSKTYTNSLKAGKLVFYIPYYSGMPAKACPRPTDNSDPRKRDKPHLEEHTELAGRLFSKILGREGTNEEIYGLAMTLGSRAAADAMYDIVFSKEARNRGMGDEEFVRAVCAGLLGSVSEKRVKELTALLTNRATRQKVYENIVRSDDFANMCGKYFVNIGSFSAGPWEFVTNLYRTVFGRDGSFEEIEAWAQAIVGGHPAVNVAHSILFSKESSNKYKKDKNFITVAYDAMMGRKVDSNGLVAWNEFLEAGCTRDLVFYGLSASAEFAERCRELELTVERWERTDVRDLNPNATKFVARLYKVCLGRKYDENGLIAWVTALADGYSGTRIAEGFVNSREFVAATEDDEEYVARLYSALLGREADKAGAAAWTGALAKGYSRDHILHGFLDSREFAALCEQYMINV